jgi:hypothetical protein
VKPGWALYFALGAGIADAVLAASCTTRETASIDLAASAEPMPPKPPKPPKPPMPCDADTCCPKDPADAGCPKGDKCPMNPMDSMMDPMCKPMP